MRSFNRSALLDDAAAAIGCSGWAWAPILSPIPSRRRSCVSRSHWGSSKRRSGCCCCWSLDEAACEASWAGWTATEATAAVEGSETVEGGLWRTRTSYRSRTLEAWLQESMTSAEGKKKQKVVKHL